MGKNSIGYRWREETERGEVSSMAADVDIPKPSGTF